MRRLRAECPWKAEQTHRSLVRYLLEETAETVEAIDAGEVSGDWSHLAEELGDVLLQVVFHAAIAEERGEFDLDDVARGITTKMRRRNPHVFGETPSADLDAAAVNDLWQKMKAREGKPAGAVEAGDSLPAGLSALLYADKVLDRLDRSGRPVTLDAASADLGERLLALVAEARTAGVDPEQALRDAVRARS
ncbi:nucleoside triphosphate pyrophosphohydrolase [Nocardioides caeni]|uniref:Nucleoside triphosphate pyrophosphohydrolase n=2 Tax=Nocardioides caeni TaxID=574700 RepID=A0A4S8NN82_9ACTN|nr:nucleoside triphosphate pyrophosphohydrolase [Nocardioides caeni]